MPSYNLVNGRPNHVARELLNELRSWTDASLLVVSDAAAPGNLVDSGLRTWRHSRCGVRAGF